MLKNVGTLDRRLRAALGLALLALAVFGGFWLGWIGIIPLGTAFIGFCPAYRLLGMNTCPIGSPQA